MAITRRDADMTASRALRHGIIGCGCLVVLLALFAAFVGGSAEFRISLATAYVALCLLGITFALGPLYYLLGRGTPASTYLRRDFAIWGALFSIVHVLFGLQVHFKGRMLAYFMFEDCSGCWTPLRYDAFGIANYTGAAAAIIVLVLLAISNDFSLRRLGLARWTAIQHWGSVCIVLTLAHTLIYELLEKRTTPAVIAAWTIVAIVAALRAWRWFARRAATGD